MLPFGFCRLFVHIPWGVCVQLPPGEAGSAIPAMEHRDRNLLSLFEQCFSLHEESAAAFWGSSETSKSLQPQISHHATELTREFLSFNGYQCFHLLFFLHIFLQKPMPLPAPQFYLVHHKSCRVLISDFAFTGQMRQISNINQPLSTGLTKTWLTKKNPQNSFSPHPPLYSCLRISQPQISDQDFYLNSCSLTTSPRYSMMNCPAFRGSLVRMPQPFSSARNLSRHCTHSCLWMRWLQHCSPQGHVLGEHSAKIILKHTTHRVKGGQEHPLGAVMIINPYVKSRWKYRNCRINNTEDI